MAGNEDLLRSGWPHGEDGYLILHSHVGEFAPGGTSIAIVDALTIPFAFTPYRVEVTYTKRDPAAGTLTLDIDDDESSPQTLVHAHSITTGATGASAPEVVTIDDKGPFLANGVLKVSLTNSAGSDIVWGVNVRIWIRPYLG